MEAKVDDIITSYEEYIGGDVKIYASPGGPNSVLDKNEREAIGRDQYRSLVCKIMFFETKVGPKISNQVRDLARHMSNPGQQHWIALGRIVGYMKGIKLKGMIMKKPVDLRTVSLMDSDFAKDPVTRKSVGGELHTLEGYLIAFCSKGEKPISNSTAEAEYKISKFQQMLLDEMLMSKLQVFCWWTMKVVSFL